MKKIQFLWTLILAISLLSCKSGYEIVSMSAGIVEMDASFDEKPDAEMQLFVQTYKAQLDKEMNEVIGTSAQYMPYGRPESLLTNLTADVMKSYGDEHLPNGADMGVMNVHGHRATMPKGKITVGNLFEIYSFDNTLAILELKGADLKKMFDAYARIGGAGISSNIKLIIKDKKVNSVTVSGQPIEDEKVYTIVTLDYLADGNDNMSAFKQALSNENTGITIRDWMIDYVKEQTRQGKEIESRLDGRITIIK